MKNITLPLAAIVISIIGALTTKADSNITKPLNFDYFIFYGMHGQEADETKWGQISAVAFSAINCNGVDQQGCTIIAASNGGNNPRPLTITVDSNFVPVISNTVYTVNNQSL